MIQFETRIEELVAMLPTVTVGDITKQPSFYLAKTQEQVNNYLSLQNDPPYPLILLITNPEKHNLATKQIEKDCTFVVATREFQKDELNTVRLANSFSSVLNPVLANFVEILESSSITEMIGESVDIDKVFNYTNVTSPNSNSGGLIDVWDAIVLKCNIRMRDGCLKPYPFN